MPVLTKAQAEIVYRAMCELNNLGAVVHVRMPQGDGTVIHVKEYMTGEVNVWYGDACGNPVVTSNQPLPLERYSTQDSFRILHGLASL